MLERNEELIEEILSLFHGNNIEAAANLVKETWLIFPHLPGELRDNNQIAFSAVSADMQLWRSLGPELINDIDFFIKVFNSVNRNYIGLENPRDMLFMTEYANVCCMSGHKIPSHHVIEKYNYMRNINIEKEANAAKDLIVLIKNWRAWFKGDIINDQVACVGYLYNKLPGFKLFTYIYSYKWAFYYSAQEMRQNYL